MGRKTTFCAAIAACVLLSACGGGGSSASPPATGGGSSGGGGGTPTPTPTPGPTYSLFSQLTGDQQFKSSCGGLYNLQQPVSSDGFGRFPELAFTISHDFNAANETWSLSGQSPGGDTIDFSFGLADTVSTTFANTVAYARQDAIGFTNRLFVSAPTIGGTVAEYSRGTATFLRVPGGTVFSNCVIGVPTLLDDRPSSTVNYSNFAINGNVFITPPRRAAKAV